MVAVVDWLKYRTRQNTLGGPSYSVLCSSHDPVAYGWGYCVEMTELVQKIRVSIHISLNSSLISKSHSIQSVRMTSNLDLVCKLQNNQPIHIDRTTIRYLSYKIFNHFEKNSKYKSMQKVFAKNVTEGN